MQRSWKGWKSLRDTEKTLARRRMGSNITVYHGANGKEEGGGRHEGKKL